MTTDAQADYERGVTAGEVAARLAGHDAHFAALNGHLSTVAAEMHQLNMNVQRLGDQAEAAAKTVVTTAAALKAAEEARRDKTAQTWSPVQKTITIILAAVAVAGFILAFIR